MSEYWKSTPKYWCKHCKTFVRDTKLEKSNHEATPKHQGNLKRFLRDLHRGHERDEKDKERAKLEVARLNGLVTGSGTATSSASSLRGGSINPISKTQATPSQRKQQLAQLAEMGVSIPDEFRGGMAMAGEWQVTNERVINPAEGNEQKSEGIGFGVRKRSLEGEESDEDMPAKKSKWGSTFRKQLDEDEEFNLDKLLNNATSKVKPPFELAGKIESPTNSKGNAKIKVEETEEGLEQAPVEPLSGTTPVSDGKEIQGLDAIREDAEAFEPGPTFKKRPKIKSIRQK